ncbi:hypothetical protein BOTBODRAFT_564673 [Botryobasidium botryosum FD-172 SS1]|uniref:Uncharacterized protein n=1 Tax=Botryobasidium botryosum (strain FD-172 SS1) TaxID=930990 RepID=A0A067M9M2_BOTB1|nr:hypothetical protein BOTBODRAFT_564673 [Botryobasidium botryosum FD-172 SS1]
MWAPLTLRTLSPQALTRCQPALLSRGWNALMTIVGAPAFPKLLIYRTQRTGLTEGQYYRTFAQLHWCSFSCRHVYNGVEPTRNPEEICILKLQVAMAR